MPTPAAPRPALPPARARAHAGAPARSCAAPTLGPASFLATARRPAAGRVVDGAWLAAVTRLLPARGQASVELVVLLPVILVVLAVAYQAMLAGQAVWEARVAARAAARAHAFGADPAAAARTHLRSALERGLRVTSEDEGAVRVSVRVPAVLPSVRLGRVSATSHFQPQTG